MRVTICGKGKVQSPDTLEIDTSTRTLVSTLYSLLPASSTDMSSSSAAARVFNGCRALFAPAKAASTSASAATAKKKAGTPAKKPRTKSPPKPRESNPNRTSGIFKVGPVSPALASLLGATESSRADSVRQIWSYIKTHNLQNPQNKREIICDAKLKAIFDGKDVVGFLEIGKLLTRHFV
ncbi:hypothetical protein Q3G72_034314 [Acer saccharum]|nr:hypothetical protein Q3G72_034314 [Acer saccharum]